MKEIYRALANWAFRELEVPELSPMVFISGPRQVGKTWLVKRLDAAYFNWDTPEVRRSFIKEPYFFRSNSKLVIFDEVHKRRDWKKVLKGYYDSPSRNEDFVVTGSGKMGQYIKGGDSLQGRYDLFHLWPVTYDEFNTTNIKNVKPSPPRDWGSWIPASGLASDEHLIKYGGFPKPLLKSDEKYLRRWQDQYLDRLVREDTRDFSSVKCLDQLDLLARILPERVGSPVSVKSLSEDIEASTVAITSWLRLFEILYLGFRLRPYHRKIHRAVKKEPKWCFFQWTFVEDEGSRFENYLAVQLSAACKAWSEQGYGRWELYYLRDQDRREIDFLICKDMKPKALIEAKRSFQNWPTSLNYYCDKLKVPGYLVYPSYSGKDIRRIGDKGWIVPSSSFLNALIIS